MKVVVLLVLVFFVQAFEARQKHHENKGKKHRPMRESPDSMNKAAWMKIANFHKADKDQCKSLRCPKKQVCMYNSESRETECISKKFLRKQKRQLKQHHKKSRKHKYQNEDDSESKYHHVEFKKKAKELKEKAKNYQKHYEKKMKAKLENIKNAFDYIDIPPQISGHVEKKEKTHKVHTYAVEKPNKDCSARELEDMGKRLLE